MSTLSFDEAIKIMFIELCTFGITLLMLEFDLFWHGWFPLLLTIVLILSSCGLIKDHS